MAKKKGWVTSISADGWAQVITERGDACNNCEASHFCHSLADCSKVETSVLNQAGAGVGDRVTIALSSKMVLKGAFILYIIPVAGLLLGAITGASLSQNLAVGETVASMAFGFAGLVIGFIITVLISKWFRCKNKLTPVITQINLRGR